MSYHKKRRNKEVFIMAKESDSNKPSDPLLLIKVQPMISKVQRNVITGLSDSTQEKVSLIVQNATAKVVEATIVVSCVQADAPHQVHPFRLMNPNAKEDKGKKNGILSQTIKCNEVVGLDDMILDYVFESKDISKSLKDREKLKVDPFSKGFNWDESKPIDKRFRLCFQAFLKYPDATLLALEPKLSNILTCPDQKIVEPRAKRIRILSTDDQEIPVAGGKELKVKCEGLAEGDDIKVILEQRDKNSSKKLWSASVKASKIDIHEGVVTFKTPPYHDFSIKDPIKVRFSLYKCNEKTFSKCKSLWFMPRIVIKVEALDSFDAGPVEDVSESKSMEQDVYTSSSSSSLKIDNAFSISSIPSTMDIKMSSTSGCGSNKINDKASAHKTVIIPNLYDQIKRSPDDPKILSSLHSSLKTLTKALNSEREANKYFFEQANSLQEHNEELQKINDLLEQKLDAVKTENEALGRENKILVQDMETLNNENIQLSNRIAFLEQSNTDLKDRSIIEHLRKQEKELKEKIDTLAKANQELRNLQNSQRKGVANMKWQLEQKEALIRALEAKLEETYPVINGDTSFESSSPTFQPNTSEIISSGNDGKRKDPKDQCKKRKLC